jgi:hypothetical protein
MSYSPNIPRCQHIKVNGTQCGSPALRHERFCYFHKRWHEDHITIAEAGSLQVRPSLSVPVLEDANSVQVALMQVIQLLLSAQIDHRTAGLALYGLQTASINIRYAKFEHARKEEIVIDLEMVDQTQLGDWLWSNDDFEDEDEENQEPPAEIAAQTEREVPPLRGTILTGSFLSGRDDSAV